MAVKVTITAAVTATAKVLTAPRRVRSVFLFDGVSFIDNGDQMKIYGDFEVNYSTYRSFSANQTLSLLHNSISYAFYPVAL